MCLPFWTQRPRRVANKRLSIPANAQLKHRPCPEVSKGCPELSRFACPVCRRVGSAVSHRLRQHRQGKGMNSSSIEHVDVLIIGAGISGIGAARYLRTLQPGKTFAILEARDEIGGTWDLFRYPGIRSDSDLHTFSYEFKAWENEKAIASADSIMAYLRETVAENGIRQSIRFQHKVISAAWSSGDARWLVEIERVDTGEHVTMSCGWF